MFSGSALIELPLGLGRRWLDTGGVANLLLGGWQLSGWGLLRGGLPFSPILASGPDYLGTRMGGWRPDRVVSGKLDSPTTQRWFDPSAFVRPCDENGENCRFGNAGRNILREDGEVLFNMALMKDFDVTEDVRMQFRWEVFNLFNTPTFGRPEPNLDDADVGTVTSTRSDPRIMQFALRVEF